MALPFAAAGVVSRARRAIAGNGLLTYAPTTGQLALSRDQHRLRAAISGNRVGKTTWGAIEAARHTIGVHPHRRVRRQVGLGLICVGNWKKPYQAVCRKLHEYIPHSLIDWKESTYRIHGHWVGNRIVMLDGFVVEFVSSKGGSISSASVAADWLWIDEPPKYHQMGELVARVADTSGPIWITATPVDSEQDLTWLRIYLEGDADDNITPSGDWGIHRLSYSPENCPWKSEAEIEEQIALYGDWERAQRVHGAWEGPKISRWFSHFTESLIFGDDLELPEMQEIIATFDWGEGAGKTVGYLQGWDGGRLWTMGEYVARTTTDPMQDALGLRRVCRAWGMELSDIARVFGDINSAGKAGAGSTVNELFGDACQRLEQERLGPMAPAPFHVESPGKGAGSVKRRVKRMNNACLARRVRVHESCKMLVRAAHRYAGPGDDSSHPIDGWTYGASDYFTSTGQVARVRLVDHRIALR